MKPKKDITKDCAFRVIQNYTEGTSCKQQWFCNKGVGQRGLCWMSEPEIHAVCPKAKGCVVYRPNVSGHKVKQVSYKTLRRMGNRSVVDLLDDKIVRLVAIQMKVRALFSFKEDRCWGYFKYAEKTIYQNDLDNAREFLIKNFLDRLK